MLRSLLSVTTSPGQRLTKPSLTFALKATLS